MDVCLEALSGFNWSSFSLQAGLQSVGWSNEKASRCCSNHNADTFTLTRQTATHNNSLHRSIHTLAVVVRVLVVLLPLLGVVFVLLLLLVLPLSSRLPAAGPLLL